ncbi:MAG: alpha/beta hydrolase [Fusobacteriaceae bacterium]|jgi:hypothetical protein|nr:alpha/beta hydrolase [Fusobacteriaceae bacterium]
MENAKCKKPLILLVLSLVLLIIGAFISRYIWTSKGTVRIEEVEFTDDNGAPLRGIVYIPNGVTAENPAPGVIVNHGYSSSTDALELDAIELSRRGLVVMAMDGYDHGTSGAPTPLKKADATTGDYGIYSVVQYFGKLPYVDKTKIGVTGHSMGAENSRGSTLRSYQAHETDPSIITPKAVFLQANSPKLTKEGVEPLNAYPIDYGVSVGRWDEFAIMLWGIPKASDYKNTKAFKAMVGIEAPEYDTLYAYGSDTPLTREQAIQAGEEGKLRIGWIQDNTHSFLCFNGLAAARTLEFFDLSLCGGKLAEKLPYTDQIWHYKVIGASMMLAGFVLLMIALGMTLLQTAFFKPIVQPEPVSLITLHDGKAKGMYTAFYVFSFLVPAFLFTWANEIRVHATWANVIAPQIKFPTTNFWNLPVVNGAVVFNVVHGAIMIALFAVIYFLIAKPNGGKFSSTGLTVSPEKIGKSILLAIVVFVIFYIVVHIFHAATGMEFGFYKFYIKAMSADKWGRFIKYFLFFFVYALISGVLLNSITRVNGLKEWQNFLLMLVVSVGGLALFQFVNYQVLYKTGYQLLFFVPGTAAAKGAVPVGALAAAGLTGGGLPNCYSGIVLYASFFSVPAGTVLTRVFYKKTGNVWAGAMLVGLFSTFLAVCGANVGRIL